MKQSIVMDYIEVKSEDQPWPKDAAPWYTRVGTMTYDFFSSFYKGLQRHRKYVQK